MDDFLTLIEINPEIVLTTIYQNYPWTAKQLSCFKELLFWDKVSQNENIILSEKIIDVLSDKLGFESLPMIHSIIFTLQLIEKYKNKWDWLILTDKPNIPRSLDLIYKYKDNWCWESYEFVGNLGLSLSVYLPWNDYLIGEYADRWFLGVLSSNSLLPWSFRLIKKYVEKWTWDGHWELSINSSAVVRKILNTYYPERIDKVYNVSYFPTICKVDNLFIDAISKSILKAYRKGRNHFVRTEI